MTSFICSLIYEQFSISLINTLNWTEKSAIYNLLYHKLKATQAKSKLEASNNQMCIYDVKATIHEIY
jgi:hypothetical protein